MSPPIHPPERLSYNLIDSEVGFDHGLSFRKSRSGPEEDLVLNFLSKLSSKSEPGIQLTIFKEPWLESGSPDLVGVFWHLPTAEKWSCNRVDLQPFDFRVLHQLANWGKTDAAAIQNLFGRRSADSLDRLQAASMITVEQGKASVSPVHTLYAVRHIFAIEAKIRDWRNALRQAFLNRWFATSSHVLLPRMPSNGNAVAEARSLGVGLWGPEVTKLALKPPISFEPISYASWLFNDWAWKHWTQSSSRYAESKHDLVDY
jgi:hypothetical protein